MIVYLEKVFRENQDKVNADKMAAYMRNLFPFYGIMAPLRKSLYKEIIQVARKEKSIDWDLLERAYQREEREWQYFVIDYLIGLKKHLVFEDLERIEPFLRTKQWWDSIDNLDEVVASIVSSDTRGRDYILQMAQDDDFWIRRVAINHQLLYKDKTDSQLLEEIIRLNFGSKEFFINKAIGWSLRDYGKTNPKWVKDFLRRYENELSPLSKREAGKYLG